MTARDGKLDRRQMLGGVLALPALAGLGAAAAAAGGAGVVLVHGKQDVPGGSLGALASRLAAAGFVTDAPAMPWARGRYLSGNWAEAMAIIAASVKSVRGQGASTVVLIGHSMGCPAILSYAARSPGLAALVLTAPGHNPTFFYENGLTRESVDRARAMVKAGKGAEVASFADSNQSATSTVTLGAADYLSFLDPAGPAVMGRYAGSIKVPVMLVVGTADPGAMGFARQFGRSLVKPPRGRYVEVGTGHGGTPGLAAAEIVEWIRAV